MSESNSSKKTFTSDSVCCGPLCDACEDCKDLYECFKNNTGEAMRFSVLPHFIVDHLPLEVGPKAYILFTYLNRRVGFKKGASNYGKAYLTYDQIKTGTGISTNYIGKYAKVLQDKGLITHTKICKKNFDSEYFTQHIFEVHWRKYLDGIKERYSIKQ